MKKTLSFLWEDANRLASVGHDGHLCILDPRCLRMPLQAVPVGKQVPTPNKLLCVAWLSKDTLVVGASDGKVSRISLQSESEM